MTDVMKVKLLFVADETRDNPQLDNDVLVGYEPTITAKLNKRQREQIISELCTKIRSMCNRADGRHNCVSTKMFHNIYSAHVMVIYGRQCLSSSDDFDAFFQAANNIVRKARIATVRKSTHC